MRLKGLFAAVFVSLALVNTIPASAQEKAVDPAKKQHIEKLLAITKASQLGGDMISQLVGAFRQSNPDVPADFWQDFQNKHSGDEFTQMLVKIYDEHLSDKEITDITAFYESPTGQKFIASLPDIMQSSAEAGQRWGRGLGQELVNELQAKGYMKDKSTGSTSNP